MSEDFEQRCEALSQELFLIPVPERRAILARELNAARAEGVAAARQESVPMLLWCPECGERHIDEGEFATRVHTTHACQNCGHCWRPAIVPTCGVRFLPGFKT